MKLKRLIFFISLFAITLTLFNVSEVTAIESEYYLELGERVLRNGDEGTDVALLQRKLKEENFYEESIDGLFGPNTERAVKDFQQANNLTVDGVAGPETISNLPREDLLSRVRFSRDEIISLARIIHGEARGEPFKGQIAVGAVVMNRVESDKFPDTIREVILQDGQFSCLFDGQANYQFPSEQEINAARAAMMGYDPSRGSLFFYNPEIANLYWISGRPIVKSIGEHVFAH